MISRKLFTLLIISLLASMMSKAQSPQVRFEGLDVRDGLSHNRVSAIYQDKYGFMWFGTRSGINRYDGNNVVKIEFGDNNPFSPSDPDMVWIKEGPDDNIWVKSHYGVFCFDIKKERFVDNTWLLLELQISNYNLNDIIKDDAGNFWFLIEGVGVKKYSSKDSSIYHFGASYRDVTGIATDPNGQMALLHSDGMIELVDKENVNNSYFIQYPEHLWNTVGLQIFIDKDGAFWFYNIDGSHGLCYFDDATKDHRHFGEEELGSNLVSAVIQDNTGRVMVGVDHGGLTIFDKSDWSYINFVKNTSDPMSLSHNSIIAMYQDDKGLIWLGTNKGGVNYFSSKGVSFSFYKQFSDHPINANDVWSIVEADNGNLWLGTDGGGLTYFDRKSGKYTNYTHDPNNKSSLSSDIIVSTCKGADGGLWVGTYYGGLNYFDGKTFKTFYHDEKDHNSISDNSVWCLKLDSQKRLWVGTLRGGVDVYDENFNKIDHFGLINQKLHSDYITTFCEDNQGRMWIGTGFGVEVYDPRTKEFEHFFRNPQSQNSLSNNSILHIIRDKKGNMWMGTMYGLNMYDQSTGHFTSYTKEDGLPENMISAIEQDESGNLWLSTPKGISKLTFKEGQPNVQKFDISDGLQGDVFNERSVLKLQNGQMAFGGRNGLNIFDPEKILVHENEDKLVFLNFFISNQQIKPGQLYNGKVWIEDGLNNIKDIKLKHNENSFTLEFTSISFYRQENILYKYKLHGFDKDWVIGSSIHRANYTNLYPGVYRFELMASDQTKQWSNTSRVIDIEILSPWWQTPLAYFIYMIFMALVLYFIRRIIIQKERFRARIDNDQLEAQRLHELDLMKIKFFTNISHEFRTPLSLIISPIERLLNSSSGQEVGKQYLMIHRNAKRLLTLVNQLLDFRKMEANQHKLSLSTGDLVDFIKSIIDSFSDLSTDRRINVTFESQMKEFLTLFDRDKMEKIMFNLISNAIKFSHSGGKITLGIEEVEYREHVHIIRISVADTGIGIPKDRLTDVFNRFFQLDNTNPVNLNHGSGIGLSITKEFVEMHEGEIWVESELDKGSKFIFELPMKKLVNRDEFDDVDFENLEDDEPQIKHKDKATLMLVDDNSDFRFYLKDNLKVLYNIEEACDGKEAWRKILSDLPELLVTDIMMPEMNGIQLCRKVKNDPRTAHIPVILLTAHYSDNQKLEGFEAGASEYITKPFNFEILVQTIRSSIQLQKFIHAQENRIEAKPKEIEITSLDEKFIIQALEIVEKNISNANFSVQELSQEMAVSRGQLYKKTLELAGTTPIEFIREVRIKRAAALLSKSQLNVAEVAYSVGFNNPKYFTKYFKKAFKMLPSKYASTTQNNN